MAQLNRMSEPATSKLYDLWAWFYDVTFGVLVHTRHIRAVKEIRAKPGDRILDLGVGTGMTLSDYPHDVTVVGMDLSAGMLAKARKKCEESKLDHIQLMLGDAMHPPFADATFDHILIAHTVSVVSQPNRLMQWAARMVKPGGTVVLLNHFRSTNRVMGWCEKVTNPFWVKVGWRSDLTLEECLEDVGLHIQYRYKTTKIDLWQIIVLSPKRMPEAGPADATASGASPRHSPLAMQG